jgi:hypothetical protein
LAMGDFAPGVRSATIRYAVSARAADKSAI